MTNFKYYILGTLIFFGCMSRTNQSKIEQNHIKSVNSDQKNDTRKTMKRNSDGSIFYELTERYSVIGHLFNTDSTESILYLPYQVVTIYTNQGTSLSAFKYVKGNGMFENYSLGSKGQKIFNSREPLAYENIPTSRDFSYNCYGKSFCDGGFWFDFNELEEEQIIQDETLSYSTNEKDIKEESIILLYQNGKRIHGIKVDDKGNLMSKDGTQELKIYSSWNEFKKLQTNYAFNSIRVLN